MSSKHPQLVPCCERCGTFRPPEQWLPEPWCNDCIKNFRNGYQSVWAAYLLEHSEDFLREMNVPASYQSCSFDNFEVGTKELRRVVRSLENWSKDGSLGLYLCGPVGVGKTHLAVSALLAMRTLRHRGCFVSVQELLLQCRDSFRRNGGLAETLDEYSQNRVLLLDDLGAENVTEFSRETIGILVDRAYRNDRQLIVTSNLDLEALALKLDARIADRLVEMCQAIRLVGASYRQRLATERSTNRMNPATGQVQ